ncbi:hypothetical protein [Flavobacterium lindanitolerans]|uniref:hypothetical protein n=1 Tax=Flavobacterium lindanitolerans TaxID=428988 RepID=UPI00280A30C6|nr:hypothetical protein [Flavobacterium lindanitolerans]MDQ7960377.1 hypothetical protein [Flavobacterium lindanitolerans]
MSKLKDIVSELEGYDPSSNVPDKEDLEKAEKQEKSIEAQRLEAKLQRYQQDTNHRSSLVVWAATIVSFWLISIVFILTRNTESYQLSDKVMITLLVTTTANILGLMYIVLNDLFKGKPKTREQKNKIR